MWQEQFESFESTPNNARQAMWASTVLKKTLKGMNLLQKTSNNLHGPKAFEIGIDAAMLFQVSSVHSLVYTSTWYKPAYLSWSLVSPFLLLWFDSRWRILRWVIFGGILWWTILEGLQVVQCRFYSEFEELMSQNETASLAKGVHYKSLLLDY